jgi:hypothetical protein
MNEGELLLCQYFKGVTGSYFTRLIDTALHADAHNLYCLRKTYPELIQSIMKYKTDITYWPDLKKRYNDVYKGDPIA